VTDGQQGRESRKEKNMQFKPQTNNGSAIIDVEPGTYEAVLAEVRGYRGKKYGEDAYEPKLVFIWDLGEDEDGNPILMWDFVRIPRDKQGYPVLNDASHFYNRVSALYGKPFDVEDPQYAPEITFPDEYNSIEGLDKLPTFEEAKADPNFEPVLLESLKVAGVELLGREALITIEAKGDRTRVKSAAPKVRAKRPRAAKRETADLPGV